MGATVFAARAPWGASSAGEAALCLLPAAPRALRHTQPRMSSHRPTFDQPSRITRWHPGKAGKGPLPKLPGRVLYRAAADRRNTTRATIRECSRQSYRAGRSSTTAQLRKTDTLVAGSAHPAGAGNGSGHVPRFSPGFVQVSRSAPVHALAGRGFQERSARQDRPGRTAGRRRPPVPTSTPRRRRRAPTHSAQHRRRTSTALPARALFIYPGRFSSPQTAPAPWPYNSRYRECPRPRSSGGCTGADAFPYNLRLYGIKSALPGRQHERGIPLSNSPQRRGPAPHTPRQRFAAAPRPAPGAGPVDTPRRHPQDQLANIATQTQT